MPLVNAPNRGYPDWQRISNFDSGILIQQQTPGTNATYGYGTLDVSRYAYLGGLFKETVSQSRVLLQWYSDSALSVLVGQRQFTLDQHIGAFAQIRIPNLGPFVTIQALAVAGQNYAQQAYLLGTNRYNPLELIPQGALLVDQQFVALPANSNTTLYPGDYYSGPARMFFQAPGAGWNWNVAVLTSSGAWDYFDSPNNTTTNGNTSTDLLIPSGAIRFTVTNTSAANGNYYLVLAPSSTGST